jgi:hypothetical protein
MKLMDYSDADRSQLAAIFECSLESLDAILARYVAAAEEEYVSMILGQRVFTRGSDIREYRLFLLIQRVFVNRLPSERAICALFQTSTTQGRALLRAVLSKYQYQLQYTIETTLEALIQSASQDPESEVWSVTVDSECEIDALNRRLSGLDGTLPQVAKSRGLVGTYEIRNSAYEALKSSFS